MEKIEFKMPYTGYGMRDKTDKRMVGASLPLNGNPGAREKRPFYMIAKDSYDTDIVNLFIKAVANNGPDDATVYLSKNLKAVGSLDFDELKKVFNKNIAYKYLSQVRFSHMPEQILTNSILVMNNQIQKSSIVHVYMVKEPDRHGSWKICGIERE